MERARQKINPGNPRLVVGSKAQSRFGPGGEGLARAEKGTEAGGGSERKKAEGQRIKGRRPEIGTKMHSRMVKVLAQDTGKRTAFINNGALNYLPRLRRWKKS